MVPTTSTLSTYDYPVHIHLRGCTMSRLSCQVTLQPTQDQCGGDSYEHHGQNKNMSWLAFQRGFKECLQSTGRAIVQSVESCGSVDGCGQWIANRANLWRTGSDLEATWGSVMKVRCDHSVSGAHIHVLPCCCLLVSAVELFI